MYRSSQKGHAFREQPSRSSARWAMTQRSTDRQSTHALPPVELSNQRRQSSGRDGKGLVVLGIGCHVESR